jgi:hypothetical protein
MINGTGVSGLPAKGSVVKLKVRQCSARPMDRKDAAPAIQSSYTLHELGEIQQAFSLVRNPKDEQVVRLSWVLHRYGDSIDWKVGSFDKFTLASTHCKFADYDCSSKWKCKGCINCGKTAWILKNPRDGPPTGTGANPLIRYYNLLQEGKVPQDAYPFQYVCEAPVDSILVFKNTRSIMRCLLDYHFENFTARAHRATSESSFEYHDRFHDIIRYVISLSYDLPYTPLYETKAVPRLKVLRDYLGADLFERVFYTVWFYGGSAGVPFDSRLVAETNAYATSMIEVNLQ